MLPRMAIRRAVLFAAGRGTRLGALTAHMPKPLLDVAGAPLIAHIVGGLIEGGLHEFIIVEGYLGEQIARWCTEFARANAGMTIQGVRQRHLDGTAGAMLAARDLLAGEQHFIFGWGDILMDPGNYPRFLGAARSADYDLLLALNRVDDPWRGAAVYVTPEMRVERLVEKPERGTSATNWNNAGLFAATPLLFDYIARLEPSSRRELELPQAIAAMIADERVVRAVEMRGFWSDVGTPEDLEAARAHFGNRRP